MSPRVSGSYRPWVNSRLLFWSPGSDGVPRQLPLRAPVSVPVAVVKQPPARSRSGQRVIQALGELAAFILVARIGRGAQAAAVEGAGQRTSGGGEAAAGQVEIGSAGHTGPG